jgi:hypothetical protein
MCGWFMDSMLEWFRGNLSLRGGERKENFVLRLPRRFLTKSVTFEALRPTVHD